MLYALQYHWQTGEPYEEQVPCLDSIQRSGSYILIRGFNPNTKNIFSDLMRQLVSVVNVFLRKYIRVPILF